MKTTSKKYKIIDKKKNEPSDHKNVLSKVSVTSNHKSDNHFFTIYWREPLCLKREKYLDNTK